MKRIALLISTLSLIFILSGCIYSGGGGVSHGSFKSPKTHTFTDHIDIKESNSKLYFDLRAEAKKGTINIIVKDPSGKELLNEMIEGHEKYHFTIEPGIKAGKWEIITILDNAVGEYRYKTKYK